jgi:hypothetical protein
MTGSRVGGLTNTHLHPYSHIMSLTDHCIILYLTIFAVTGSWVQTIIFQVPRYPFCTRRYVIYIMNIRLVVGTELLSISFLLYPSSTDRSQHLANFLSFVGSQVHKSFQILISLVHPRHLRAFPYTHLVWFNSKKSSCRVCRYHL